MRYKFGKQPVFLLIIIILAFATAGGCDVDFGTSDDDGNGGNNGGGSTNLETVEGTIIDVIPSRMNDVANITVEITISNSNDLFFDTTGNTGFFSVDGNFSGSPELNFVDDDNNQNSLGRIFLNVFPRATVRLGDIRIDSGNIVFEDDIRVVFEADLVENDCINNSGTLEVEATNGNTVEVLVQITNSTDLLRDGDDISCNDLLIGQELEITGFLLAGNSVEADRIDVQ